MEICAGILRSVEPSGDYKEMIKMGWWESCGYNSLSEVAQDLENYLYFSERSYLSEYDMDTRIAIEQQLYSEAKDAMYFIAENIGGIWD